MSNARENQPLIRHARRALLRDRFTELLTGWGSPHPEHRAGELLAAVDDLGFRLPAAVDDPPPPPSRSHAEHRAQVLAEARAVLDAKRRARGDTPSGVRLDT